MGPLLLAALIAASLSHLQVEDLTKVPLNQQPGFSRASVHVGGKGPGHLSRKQGSSGGVAPTTCDGTLDLSTGCSTAVVVIF